MKAGHVTLNYAVSGKGPAVVLLHGYLSAGQYWDKLRPSLELNHTVITVDLLGFGASPHPSKSLYGYRDHLQWLEHTLRHINVPEPFTLVGHSMGALLALRYTTKHPRKIKKLILMNMPLFLDAEQARRELAGTNLLYRLGLYAGLHNLVWPIMRTRAAKKLARKTLPPPYRDVEDYIFVARAAARMGSLHHAIEQQRSIADIMKTSVETVLVIGRRDRSIYRANLAHVPHQSHLTVIFADTGHDTPLEDPELTIRLIET